MAMAPPGPTHHLRTTSQLLPRQNLDPSRQKAKPTPPLSFLQKLPPRPAGAEKKLPSKKVFVCSQTGMTITYEGPTSVIIDREAAKTWFTPGRLWSLNERRREAAEDSTPVVDGPLRPRKGKRHQQASLKAATRLSELMARYKAFSPLAKERVVAERMAREHDERQPGVLGQIVAVLKQNPSRSYNLVASDIGDWCSGDTIRRFFASMKADSVLERVLPLLNRKQRRAAVQFSKHARGNWNRGAGKYLWIHLDEKWMYGMVLQHAKVCEALGLRRVHRYAQHKNHITKVMVAALVAFAFEDSPENGGVGLRLGIHRVQAAKVAQREVNMTDPDTGKRPKAGVTLSNGFEGKLVRKSGEVWMGAVEVVANSRGTAKNPKFSLMNFLEVVFAQIAIIVGVGGEWAGYTPIFQWDGAGPHTAKALVKFALEYCETKGWAWEPQSSQCPYLNVLDLLVFPALSKKHSDLLRQYTAKTVAPADRIYEAAHNVFMNDISGVDIAKAFVLAHRLQKKVISAGGGNNFLNEGGLHCGVRADFTMNAKGTGIRRRDRKVQPAPAVLEVPHRVWPPPGFFEKGGKKKAPATAPMNWA
jgi:hypothetical protein